MMTVACAILLPTGVFFYCFFSMRKDFLISIRNSFLMLACVTMFSLPVGEFETEYREVSTAETGRCIYVAPCYHYDDGGECAAYVTPLYTSLLEMCFSEEIMMVQYCSECYTRKEAIAYYIAQR